MVRSRVLSVRAWFPAAGPQCREAWELFLVGADYTTIHTQGGSKIRPLMRRRPVWRGCGPHRKPARTGGRLTMGPRSRTIGRRQTDGQRHGRRARRLAGPRQATGHATARGTACCDGIPYPGEVIQGNFADVPPFVLAEVDGHIPLPHIAHGRHFPCQKTLPSPLQLLQTSFLGSLR